MPPLATNGIVILSRMINAFFDKLDCEPETTDRYMLTDEDGEDAFIRIGSIAMVRVVLDALEPVEEDEE